MPTLPPAASRDIVLSYRHAAGALTALALPLGRAQRAPPISCFASMETPSLHAVSFLFCFCHRRRGQSTRGLCSRCDPFGNSGNMVADFLGGIGHRGTIKVRVNRRNL